MSPEALAAALSSNVEPRKLFRWSRVHAQFQGDVSSDAFEITRIIRYRNSFLPVVRGQFLPSASGTTVAIQMELHPFVMVGMCLWFGGVGLGILTFASGLLNGQAPLFPGLLVLLGMLAFGFALVSGGFWPEAKKQKSTLIEMFEGAASAD